MNDVDPSESGLASGVANTAFMMGGALGLAVLASLAAAEAVQAGGASMVALTRGYHLAFALGALFAAAAALLAWLLLRQSPERKESWATP
jgi:sugar phosphate permease